MAIIYTYPRLLDPDGTELIVVSETKNQNATRLMTINDIVALVGPLVPGGGTVTSVKLDFSSHGVDTGLRLWSGAAFTDHDQTITTTGSFEVGGTLFATHGGTGLSTYADGDVLYYDSAASTTELQTVTFASAPVGNGDVLTLAGGLPTWATPTVGTMVNWVLTGDNALPQTIVNLDVVDIRGGNIITTVAGTPADGLTINHDNVSHTQTPTSSTLAHGGTFTAINHVTVSTEGHFTASDLETYTLPTAGVTSITTTNTIGGGIDFAATPNPIIGTGALDLKFAGAQGDILYADSATSLALLSPSTPKYVLQTSGVGADPLWGPAYESFTSAQDAANVNLVVTETDAGTDIVKLVAGTNITLVDSGANAITINSTGGGSAGTDPTSFVPILVTQGIDGTDPLVAVHTVIPNPPLTYVNRYATYSTIGSHVYIDFYLSWRLDDEEGVCKGGDWSNTLGIAVGTGEGWLDVAGLNSLVGLENLKTDKLNNAGVHITGAGFIDSTHILPPDSDNWVSMPQGGKLNHFFNGSDSVAWLHWHRNMASPGGTMQIDYSPDQFASTQWWQCPLDPDEERIIWVSGSLNPIKMPGTLKWKYSPCNCPEEGFTIWSTLPLHEEGDSVIWVNCCFYEIWSQEWTEEEDTSGVYADTSVYHYGGLNCEELGTHTQLEWLSCNDLDTIYTEMCCANPVGITDPPGFYVGLVATGFVATAETCYVLQGPTDMAAGHACSTITLANCDSAPCV
jgi:hypothetical protein